jgi:hypothetical protein
MIRKFYQSYNSLKYGPLMTFLAFAIFAEAFIYTSKGQPGLRTAMIITAVLLAVVMVFYYRQKILIGLTLRKVKDLDAYEKGGCIDRTWILEDRVLACDRSKISEHQTGDITEAVLEEKNHGKYVLHCRDSKGTFTISLMDRGDGERLAAFLQRKNPQIRLTNVTPKGKGTLQELGADGR